ncbi:amine sulfotransferase-like isoform X3 [Dermacentor albipictus]|uniref:amine sulfotransferase-like isoform X3 n=1 Tax=Dermacentor albipictus TaxID=60249 RepID=UPI0038FC78CA
MVKRRGATPSHFCSRQGPGKISITSAMAVDVRYPRGPLYRDIDGFRLNAYVSVDLYRSALGYKPRADDVFIVTFPKSGTTWTQQIGYLILHDGSPAPDGMDFFKTMPFLEMFGAEDVEKMKRPGLIKTHLPYNLVPKSPSAKYVYVCRNPKDVCVSFFYHTKGFVAYDFVDGKLEDFFDVFVQGATDFGEYFDHVLSWYAHRSDSNVLFMHYEDIKADPKNHVLKLAAFLGNEHHRKLVEHPEALDQVIELSGIDFMRSKTGADIKAFLTRPLDKEKGVCPGLNHYHDMAMRYPKTTGFIRKGVVGDWKQHFTPEMNAEMEAKIYQRLAGTEIIDVWKRHGIL